MPVIQFAIALSFLLISTTSTDTLYLSLDEALQLALKGSPGVVEGTASRVDAAVSLGRGISNLLPTPSATLTSAKNELATAWKGDITITQVVFDPLVYAGLINGIINFCYHSLDAREKISRLVYDVTTDYFQLLKSQLLFAGAQKALAQAEESQRLTAERFRLGQAAKIDLLRSQAFYSQAQLNLLSAEKALTLAQSNLCARLGISSRRPLRAKQELGQPAELSVHDPDSLLLMMEKFNPGVRMLKDLKMVAAINLLASFARILPGFSLYRSYQYSDTTFPRSYQHWQEKSTRVDGISLTFPIADIKTFILNIGDALAGSRRARAALARARLQLRAAAQGAILGYEEARRRYEQAELNLELNRELYELAATQYRLGALSLSELLEAEIGLTQAEATYLSALCDTYIQSAEIAYLLGKTAWK